MSEYDERVIDYWKISGINYIVKMIDDTGLEDEVKNLNTMPLHLGSFVLSNSKRIMNILYTQLTDFIQMISTMKLLTAFILRIIYLTVNSPTAVARKRILLPVAITPLIISHINYGVCVWGGRGVNRKDPKKILSTQIPQRKKRKVNKGDFDFARMMRT